MSYTKGPWYAKLNPSQGLVISEKTGETIAVSYEKNNTHLIASAPDLLEACKEALWLLEAIKRDNLGQGDTLRKAIAKAEGRE